MQLTSKELKRIEALQEKINALYVFLEKRHAGEEWLLGSIAGARMSLEDAITEHDTYHKPEVVKSKRRK